mmetsp:Transcript_16099/g.37505  ORF Transcript_16099/g.37505 Transcript_16099/m.37505 type:complete len:146 (+) Transcript_16099:1199-1636(+)
MIFLFSKRLSTRLGVHGVLYLSTTCYGIRLFAYGYWVSNAWWLVVFEPLHALTFSLPMGSLGAFTTALADAAQFSRVSAQGFRTGTMNLGRAFGFLVSAWLYETFSPGVMFRAMGWLVMPMMMLAVVMVHRQAKKHGVVALLYPE